MKATRQDELRARIADYLRSHRIMTIATTGAEGNAPHAADVFYAMDEHMRLIFLSKRTSLHGRQIGKEAPVAVTVSQDYEEWRDIQGVQLWGKARLLTGTAETGALTRYLTRFPFAKELIGDPGLIAQLRDIGVYRVEPDRAGFTDNSTGLLGRETLESVSD